MQLRPLAVSAIVSLAACAPVEHPLLEHPWSSGPELAIQPNPELPDAHRAPLVLTVDRVAPGLPSTVTMTGATPGETVYLGRSLAGLGPGPCLGTLGGLCLDIASPVVEQGSAVTDAAGVATLVQTVPVGVPVGLDVWLQALVPRGSTGFSWVKSGAVQVTTEIPLTVADLVAGDLVITEVMSNPLAVSDAAGEWFEVLNASGQDADLRGLLVTNGVEVATIATPVVVAAGDHAVFGVNADGATNGGVEVDWDYGTMELADSWGEIYLTNGALIDGVAWDNGAAYPLVEGAAMYVSPGTDHLENDLSVSWNVATQPYGDGDLGTPGDNSLAGFFGIQTDLPEATLAGWSLCWEQEYDESDSAGSIAAACPGANLLLGCKPTGSTTLSVAAHAPRADVLFDVGEADITHDANGVGWYFSLNESWGFAEPGDGVDRRTCDTDTGAFPERRMCWHTDSVGVVSGWRCGVATSLGSGWTRVIYQAG